MAKYVSSLIANKLPPVSGRSHGEVICEKSTITIPDGTGAAANDLFLLGKLPSGHDLIDYTILVDALDSSTGAAVSVGVLNDAATDLITATLGISATAAGRSSAASLVRLTAPAGVLDAVNAVSTSDVGTGGSQLAGAGVNAYQIKNGTRIIAAKLTAITTAITSGARTITLNLSYRAV